VPALRARQAGDLDPLHKIFDRAYVCPDGYAVDFAPAVTCMLHDSGYVYLCGKRLRGENATIFTAAWRVALRYVAPHTVRPEIPPDTLASLLYLRISRKRKATLDHRHRYLALRARWRTVNNRLKRQLALMDDDPFRQRDWVCGTITRIERMQDTTDARQRPFKQFAIHFAKAPWEVTLILRVCAYSGRMVPFYTSTHQSCSTPFGNADGARPYAAVVNNTWDAEPLDIRLSTVSMAIPIAIHHHLHDGGILRGLVATNNTNE
jgi:hypothetical protein